MQRAARTTAAQEPSQACICTRGTGGAVITEAPTGTSPAYLPLTHQRAMYNIPANGRQSPLGRRRHLFTPRNKKYLRRRRAATAATEHKEPHVGHVSLDPSTSCGRVRQYCGNAHTVNRAFRDQPNKEVSYCTFRLLRSINLSNGGLQEVHAKHNHTRYQYEIEVRRHFTLKDAERAITATEFQQANGMVVAS